MKSVLFIDEGHESSVLFAGVAVVDLSRPNSDHEGAFAFI
jgi:hypothetical protein